MRTDVDLIAFSQRFGAYRWDHNNTYHVGQVAQMLYWWDSKYIYLSRSPRKHLDPVDWLFGFEEFYYLADAMPRVVWFGAALQLRVALWKPDFRHCLGFWIKLHTWESASVILERCIDSTKTVVYSQDPCLLRMACDTAMGIETPMLDKVLDDYPELVF